MLIQNSRLPTDQQAAPAEGASDSAGVFEVEGSDLLDVEQGSELGSDLGLVQAGRAVISLLVRVAGQDQISRAG